MVTNTKSIDISNGILFCFLSIKQKSTYSNLHISYLNNYKSKFCTGVYLQTFFYLDATKMVLFVHCGETTTKHRCALRSSSPWCCWCCSAGMAHSLTKEKKPARNRFATNGYVNVISSTLGRFYFSSEN